MQYKVYALVEALHHLLIQSFFYFIPPFYYELDQCVQHTNCVDYYLNIHKVTRQSSPNVKVTPIDKFHILAKIHLPLP